MSKLFGMETKISRIVAIVPARSGSKGLPNKNILDINGRSLLELSIDFAKKLNVEDVICSTDSHKYSDIARGAGATVLGLRSKDASNSTAMEENIIDDLNNSFNTHNYKAPDIVVWLRPTFVFRSLSKTKECIIDVQKGGYSASRVVTEIDPRLYSSQDNLLVPEFEDNGRSMMRRQGMKPFFKVFNVDVFRWPTSKCPIDFLGDKIHYRVAPKICSVDIDDASDFEIATILLKGFKNGILP
jgi:CMP-N,N'-diacetyllegionaminic acid synthase